MPTIHLLIRGKVQGVFYRASAKEMANQLKLTGWVKNTKEGEVEIMASGEQEQLDKFVRWCEEGPDEADVDEVIVTNTDQAAFNGFTIIR